ncbi:MAG TPA: hypothetical protein VL574_10890, partial [Stellaceae bacterium]|nr:hypothetical protein [Stellaceae bacterium]
FVATFQRIRSQIASNLIGLHVQVGDAMADHRIQAYAAATRAAGDPSAGPERGALLLGTAVRSAATTQGVIDTFETLSAMAILALILLIAQRAAPVGPATHRSIFARRGASS